MVNGERKLNFIESSQFIGIFLSWTIVSCLLGSFGWQQRHYCHCQHGATATMSMTTTMNKNRNMVFFCSMENQSQSTHNICFVLKRENDVCVSVCMTRAEAHVHFMNYGKFMDLGCVFTIELIKYDRKKNHIIIVVVVLLSWCCCRRRPRARTV